MKEVRHGEACHFHTGRGLVGLVGLSPASSSSAPAYEMPRISELVGKWSSDCGIMTVRGNEVIDANGEAAQLVVSKTGRYLELHFAGETWRSEYVGNDHIRWQGDGGTWRRAGTTPATAMPRRQEPQEQVRPVPFGQPAPAYEGAVHPYVAHGAGWRQGLSVQPCPFAPPLHSAAPPWPPSAPPAIIATMPSMAVSFPSGSMHSAAQMRPQPQPASPQLMMLEAKVDYLANAVVGLHGELNRMMEIRRVGAQRRAMAEVAAATASVAAQAQAQPPAPWPQEPFGLAVANELLRGGGPQRPPRLFPGGVHPDPAAAWA